ncbi:MAG: prepilin-type N-terminal cleavage/methylation domain-containing protein [bacterium]|nr:prepilin-type N-terminal cleavage/methylation domain-containing protein [bacterium]MDI1336714.1 prepilin-type N-terminal cleavage/methylation domain-containing protein [Lacunisphaera sp.]
MSRSIPTRQASFKSGSLGSTRGFTLVEILVVVVIISLLAMLAIPAVQMVQRRAKSSAIQNDFRVFTTAFETYAHETGSFPPECAAGVVPTGLENALKIDAWLRVTPIGGHYNWEFNQMHGGNQYKAAIAITGTTDAPLPLDVNQLTDIDKAIDDGNLYTGNFFLGAGLNPVFVIEK